MKSFSLKEALENPERVITRDNNKVSELYLFTTATNTINPLVATIDGYLMSFTKEGKCGPGIYNQTNDLFLQPITKEGWINIHKNHMGCSPYIAHIIYPTKEEAKLKSTVDVVDTIKIEWEE